MVTRGLFVARAPRTDAAFGRVNGFASARTSFLSPLEAGTRRTLAHSLVVFRARAEAMGDI